MITREDNPSQSLVEQNAHLKVQSLDRAVSRCYDIIIKHLQTSKQLDG